MEKERREYPRFDVDIPSDVLAPDGSLIRVSISNISRRGLQLSCDQWAAFRIIPQGQVTSGRPVEVKASFELPHISPDANTVTVHCRAVFARRCAQNQYSIGLEYAKFEDESSDRIDRYIEHCSGKRGTSAEE